MSSRTRRFILLFALVAAALVAHCARYWPFFSDDALISLRYARRLTEGLGLTWSSGQRTEGYSNLLWVLLAAPPAALGVDLIWTARILDLLGTLLAIFVVSLSTGSLRPSATRLLTGGAALALSAPVAVWAIGGLEHGLMLGLLAAALLLGMRALEQPRPATRSLLRVSVLLGLLSLLRIDGPMLAFGFGLGACFSRRLSRDTLRTLGLLATAPCSFVLAQALFRRYYYGQWLPHTAAVKVAFNSTRLEEGLRHVQQGLYALSVLLLLAIVAVLLLARKLPRGRVVLPTSVLLVWTGYVVAAGGDIFPGWRQLLLILAPTALLIAEAAESLSARRPRAAEWLSYLLPPLAVAHVYLQESDSENQRARKELWEWDGEAVGDLLKRAFAAHNPLLAVDAAGALPYWSELESLDMLGLNDRYLFEHPPRDFGKGSIGHELGDPDYVLRRSPDLIVFCNASGYLKPCFRHGRQLLYRREFRETYQFVKARSRAGNRALAQMYIKRADGPLGIKRTPDRIEIPGYFFASRHASTEATLDDQGRLVTPISGATPGGLPALELGPGTWKLSTDPPLPGRRIAVRCPQLSATRLRPGAESSFRLWRYGRVAIGLAPADDSLVGLRSVTLERSSSGSATFGCNLQGQVSVALADLAVPKRENTDWLAPANVVFDHRGVQVSLPEPRRPVWLELSVDNNDEYLLQLGSPSTSLEPIVLEPRRNGGGLTIHRVRVPGQAIRAGVGSIALLPKRGDGSYSIGHLILRER